MEVSDLHDILVSIMTFLSNCGLYLFLFVEIRYRGPETQAFDKIVHCVVIYQLSQVLIKSITNVFRLNTRC